MLPGPGMTGPGHTEGVVVPAEEGEILNNPVYMDLNVEVHPVSTALDLKNVT